jgi:RNA polymerase sigma factor (sigma-70 family)
MDRQAATTDGLADEAGRPSPAVVRPVGPAREKDFARLYEQRYLPMVRLATLLVDRVDLAEDITQDAYAVLYRRWDEIDSPAAYLRLTVVNRSRDALRRRRLDRERPVLVSIAHDAPDELTDAIRRLPARQRVAVVLRFYEDLTVDQIAEAMHTRPGTVKSWLNRAMNRLREEIPR